MIYKRRWFIPLVIALVLLGAWFVRWDTVATKTYDTGVTKWEKDRWTGTIWMDVYVAQSSSKVSSGSEGATYIATYIWEWALFIDGIWLALALRKDFMEAKTCSPHTRG